MYCHRRRGFSPPSGVTIALLSYLASRLNEPQNCSILLLRRRRQVAHLSKGDTIGLHPPTELVCSAHVRSDVNRNSAMAAADVAPQFGAELKVWTLTIDPWVCDVYIQLIQLYRTTSNPSILGYVADTVPRKRNRHIISN